MRSKLNLDLRTLDRMMLLVHGAYSCGKTHLVGDMLRTESKDGEVRFLNIRGEDGSLSIANMGLGERGETVDTVEDFRAAVQDFKGLKLQALGVDSMKALCRIVIRSKVGERVPIKDDYAPIHFEMEGLATLLRSVAPVVLCVCPSDKSVNQLDGRTYITPDLPGREAAGSAGWFDFVGFLVADTLSSTDVKRRVSFAPNPSVITRQRLPNQITRDIEIPKDGGGWKNIRGAIEAALTQEKK